MLLTLSSYLSLIKAAKKSASCNLAICINTKQMILHKEEEGEGNRCLIVISINLIFVFIRRAHHIITHQTTLIA